MKHLFQLLTCITLLFTTSGCGNKVVQPEFDVVELDTLFTCGAGQYQIQYSFATIANSASSDALQAIEKQNIRYFFGLEEFEGSAQEATSAALAQIYRDAEVECTAEYGWKNSEALQSEAMVVDSIMVYTITSSTYTGGAHGMYGITAHNYSIAGGYELTLSDLFTETQRAALDTLIRSKLYAQFKVTGDDGLAEQGFFPEYIGTTENFAVTPEGITFYYNPYDIGCYALGDLEVVVSCEELDNL